MMVLGAWLKPAGCSSSKLPYRKLSVVLCEVREEEDFSLVPDEDDDDNDDPCGWGFFLKRGGGASDFPSLKETKNSKLQTDF